MTGRKSEKETWLNYTIQPLARQFLNAILSVQMLASKDRNVFFSLKLLCRSHILSAVSYKFDPP